MNKVVNVFSIVVLAVFVLLSMVIIYDLSISNIHLKNLPYKVEILSTLAVLLFLIGLIRVRRRWQGYKDMKKFSQFDFSSPVSQTFMKRALMFTSLEILFMLAALFLFLQLYDIEPQMMVVMLCVMFVLILESIFFLFQLIRAGQAFRIGVNSRVIAYYGREMHLFFYSGLRRVELHQKDLFSFKYKDDMVLFFPASVLEEEDRIPFREALLKQLEEKNIYFDDALRNWK
ncbi:MAG: hypothetical protein HUJ25_17205 [Crocinitomicaceae bacterium]|nr:hypothetical protein [Crocinitomicaceae bacterium]